MCGHGEQSRYHKNRHADEIGRGAQPGRKAAVKQSRRRRRSGGKQPLRSWDGAFPDVSAWCHIGDGGNINGLRHLPYGYQ